MKKPLLLAAVCLATAAQAFAQGAQAELVKQRAKAIQQQNNINQGIVPPPAPAPVVNPQPAVPPPPRGIDPTQQALIDKLEGDLAIIRGGFAATSDQKQQIQDDLLALARGVVKPSKELAAKLAADLSAALAEKEVVLKDAAPLAKDCNIVVNSLNLSANQVQTFVNAAQTVLKNSGVSDAAIQTVVGDLKDVVAELQKNKPKLY